MSIGLFAWIRKTSFSSFLLSWIIAIFGFTLVYWILSAFIPMLVVHSTTVLFNFTGLIDSLYASLLVATIFGFGVVRTKALIFGILLYAQFVFSAILVLILIDKALQKYIFPIYHIHHTQHKKINTMSMTMSIFRNDIERVKSEFKNKKDHKVDIKEIESIIDGLYITFLDIDKIFSAKNVHKAHIENKQHLTILVNIEDSLSTLSKFIDFLEQHKAEWKDKNTKFWIGHILDTAEKSTIHFDDVKIHDHRVIIAIENIKGYVEDIRKKL